MEREGGLKRIPFSEALRLSYACVRYQLGFPGPGNVYLLYLMRKALSTFTRSPKDCDGTVR